jgi:hypothetical protein
MVMILRNKDCFEHTMKSTVSDEAEEEGDGSEQNQMKV